MSTPKSHMISHQLVLQVHTNITNVILCTEIHACLVVYYIVFSRDVL